MRTLPVLAAVAMLGGCAPNIAPEVRCPDNDAEVAALSARIDELTERLAESEARATNAEDEAGDGPDNRSGVGDGGAPALTFVGVQACDEFSVAYAKCIEERFPVDSKEAAMEALRTSTDAWKKASRSEAGREGLATACASATEAVASACGWGSAGTAAAPPSDGRQRVPRVRQAKAAVSGSLDKDIIRRIVRAHINEVRYCYNQGLVRDPDLEGRVTVKFTISAAGKVPKSNVDKTTVPDENVGRCIAKAVKRWKFPKPPGGGNVVVSYPFVLAPG